MLFLESLCQVLVVLLLVAYAWFIVKNRDNFKKIGRCIPVLLLCGCLLYMYGFYLKGDEEGVVTLVLRSLVASAKLFLFDQELFEIEAAQDMPFFLDAFYLVFVAAMLTSASAIIMLFGKRLFTLMTLLRSKKKVYRHVFFGVNRPSVMIANGIDNESVAFIEFPDGNDIKEVSIEGLIKGISRKNADGSWRKKSNVTVLRAKRSLRDCVEGESILSQIGLGRLSKYVDAGTAFYILSDNPADNLHDVVLLSSDPAFSDRTIHVAARREGLAKPYQSMLKKHGVHFIFPASLAVVELISNVDNQPASFMKIDKDAEGRSLGTARGEFGALLVGFGETNRNVSKFLYELSAAVRSDGSALPVNIYAIDGKMDMIAGAFMSANPGMDHNGVMHYIQEETGSVRFWDSVHDHIDSLNYVVISNGSDELNLDFGIQILEYAMKTRREGIGNFVVFVRKTYTTSSERALVDSYNRKAGREVIRFFGEFSKIFTAGMIVSSNASGINTSASALGDNMLEKYSALCGRTETAASREKRYKAAKKAGDSMTQNAMRMEYHQFISCANHSDAKKLFCKGFDTIPDDVLEALAHGEQIRYCRYMTAHGYSYAPVDNHVTKHSSELAGWEQLGEDQREKFRLMVRAALMN